MDRPFPTLPATTGVPITMHPDVSRLHLAGLRVFYGLMAVFVAPTAWQALLTHQGDWNPLHAMAFCVWAVYPTLGILGLWHPLRMLPLMLFMLGYKTVWLAAVAFPLWRAGALWGTPTGEMAASFAALPLAYLAVPWRYVWRHLVLPASAARAAEGPQ